jgi:hypothetical protein
MKCIRRSEVGEVLQRLYDSGQDIRIESRFDIGYFFNIGNSFNGDDKRYRAGESKNDRYRIEKAITDIAEKVSTHYPESDFARWWNVKMKKSNGLQEAVSKFIESGFGFGITN